MNQYMFGHILYNTIVCFTVSLLLWFEKGKCNCIGASRTEKNPYIKGNLEDLLSFWQQEFKPKSEKTDFCNKNQTACGVQYSGLSILICGAIKGSSLPLYVI